MYLYIYIHILYINPLCFTSSMSKSLIGSSEMPISSAAMKHCKDVSTPRPKTFMNNCAWVQIPCTLLAWFICQMKEHEMIFLEPKYDKQYCIIYHISFILYVHAYTSILYDEWFVSTRQTPTPKSALPPSAKNNNLEPRLHHVTCCNICKHWQQDICIGMKGLTCGVSQVVFFDA